VSEWEKYWTPEEYASMREILAPEELEEELARMQGKAAHYRAAAEMGCLSGEAMLMRLRGMMAICEEGSAA
jgi:hypothetical protein